MRRITNLIVERNKVILLVFLLLALCSVWLMTKVSINADMSKYLPEASTTKSGMEIMNNEFPAASAFNLMFKNLKAEEKMDVYEWLAKVENVQSVSYEEGSERYNKEIYTLYVVTVDAGAYSPEAKAVVNAVKDQYAAYDISLNGEAAGNTAIDIIPQVAGIAFVILLVILFLMCESWIEPFLFLLTIAVAILINMGTNIIFDSVSEITYAIAAVLQLVLSMDYSIMLLNRYRQEKRSEENKSEAMKKALQNGFAAISSSSITTIVGMLALVFMSFTIGRDMGFVLAKGVFLSLVCIFTVLPALILLSDKLIEKTSKKSLHIKMDAVAAFSYRGRYVICVVFVLLFAGSFLLKGNVSITYTMSEYYEIDRIFPQDNPIVVLYENKDEKAIAALAEKWEQDAAVKSVNAYTTTLGKDLTYGELADAADMDETLVAMMYSLYFDEASGAAERKIAFGDFLQFLKDDVATNEQFASYFTEDDLAGFDAFGGEVRLSADEFAAYSGMNTAMVQQLFNYYFNIYGQTEDNKIAQDTLLQFILTDLASNERYAPFFTEDILKQLTAMSAGTDSGVMEQEMSSGELAAFIGMDEAIVEQLFRYYAIAHGETPQGKISLYDFIGFVTDEAASNELFRPYVTEEILAQLTGAKAEMDDGLKQLVGGKYSRAIITTSLAEESDETFSFIESLERDLDAFSGEHYLIGNSAMAYEMHQSFPKEMNFITLLTVIAIFIVVAVAFRSLSVPFVLVCIIQCAVHLTMGTVYLQGSSMYYLPLLIVQCLLLGATIDYGILYATHYREARNILPSKEAVITALNNTIHTILTSSIILISITLILGSMLLSSDPSISEILLIIARGGFCATVLVVFILPGILCAFDKWVVRKSGAKDT